MIPRYSRPEMSAIWSQQARFELWFEIEALVCDAYAELGVIPAEAAREIRARGKVDTDRILEIERNTRHEVVAFLTAVGETIGPAARHMHIGLTSSDIMDTAFNVQLVRAADLLVRELDRLLRVLERRAFEFKDALCIGRTHGVHAEPTTFGLKLAGFHAEFARGRARLVEAREEVATCVLSGPVGTYANVDPRIEAKVAERLGLRVEPISTQCAPRDRHAVYFAVLGVIAGALERLAVEIRHLQQTEICEVEEEFGTGQAGSSAMPHKRNPIFCEQLTGIARIVRRNVDPALDSIALWYEHEMSHSPVERTGGPDATIALDFGLARLTEIVERMLVHPDTMRANLERLGGLVDSQRILLALTEAGLPREQAYPIVKRHIETVAREGGSLVARLKRDATVVKLIRSDEIEALFDPRHHARHVDMIFRRVFGKA